MTAFGFWTGAFAAGAGGVVAAGLAATTGFAAGCWTGDLGFCCWTGAGAGTLALGFSSLYSSSYSSSYSNSS